MPEEETKLNSVTARATVTVEVRVGSTWNPSTTMQQIHDQARTDAEGVLVKLLHDPRSGVVRVVGPIHVTAVSVPQKES